MRPLVVGWAMAWVLVAASAAPADVIYREVFPNTSTTNNITSGGTGWPGWKLNLGAGGAGAGTGWGVSYSPGRPQDLAGIHSAPYSTEQVKGFFGSWDNNHNNNDMLFWTDEYTADLSGVGRISWYQGNGAAADVFRVAICVKDAQNNSAWYASATTFTNTAVSSGANFGAQAVERFLDFSGATWRALDFVAGSSLALGSATTLPSAGTITSFGLYCDKKTGTLRFDTYTVEAPEPATLGLLAVGLAVAWQRRRRG